MTLDAEALKRWTRLRQRAALKRWLTARGVHFFIDSKGWPITTEAELNRALDGAAKTRPNSEPYAGAKGRPREARRVVSRPQ
jgi:hypothetical protein